MSEQNKGLQPVHLSPEEQVKQELEKVGINDAVIKEMQEFLDLQTEAFINEQGVLIEQKELTKAVREARIKVKNTRIAVEKKCKTLRDGANDFIKANRAAELHILKLLEPLEKHLQEQEDKPALLKQQIEEKKEREAQERYTARLNKLSGYSLNKNFGQNFALVGTVEMSVSDIKYQSDEWFAKQIELIEAEAKAEADRVAAEKAKAEEEARQLAEQKRQQEEEAKRLEEEQRKLAEEKEKIFSERKAIRIGKLKSAGVPENRIVWSAFEQMTDVEFENKLTEIAAAQKQLQEEREAAEKKHQRTIQRQTTLRNAGIPWIGCGDYEYRGLKFTEFDFENLPDKEFQETVDKFKEAIDAARQEELENVKRETEERLKREAEEAEAKRKAEEERLAELARKREERKPDKKKINELADKVENFDFPDMKTLEGNNILKSLRDEFAELADKIRKKAAEL